MIENPTITSFLGTQSGSFFFTVFIPTAVTLALTIAAIIFFFYFLLGGIAWITSGGDKAQIESARSRLTSALIGIVIVLSVFVIVKIIEVFFGISLLAFDLDKLRLK